MSELDVARLGPLFYTGASRLLQANPDFVRSMVAASAKCPIHASEDIIDANGMKLWSRGRPVDERLLERLSERRLRKPVELCVYAADPVGSAAIAAAIEAQVGRVPELQRALEPHLARIVTVVDSIVPTPSELLLLSVMRHGGRDMVPHAATVCAATLALAVAAGVLPEHMRTLARAALFHDVGELYLPDQLFRTPGRYGTEQVRQQRAHVAIGAQVVVELAHSGAAVGHLVSLSHERLDGSGYPRGLSARDLPLAAQALLFAEAVGRLLETGPNGARRAAVAARLVPGQFPLDMVNWVSQLSQQCDPVLPPDQHAEPLAPRLQEIHTVLGQALVLLRLPVHETQAVRAAAGQWVRQVESLIWVLRSSGVEDALACGMDLEPQNDVERVELSALIDELRYRIEVFAVDIELSVAQTPEFETSGLIIEVLKALRNGCSDAAAARLQ